MDKDTATDTDTTIDTDTDTDIFGGDDKDKDTDTDTDKDTDKGKGDDKDTDGAGDDADADADSGAPEKYELSLSEDSLLEPSAIEDLSDYAREKGLSNEAAQELLIREENAVHSYQEAQENEADAIRDSWVKECKDDKEVGGDKFVESAELANRVLKRFATEEFFDVMKATSFGNHPEVLRFITRIGKMMSEDQLVLPDSQGGGDIPQTDGERFFGEKTK